MTDEIDVIKNDIVSTNLQSTPEVETIIQVKPTDDKKLYQDTSNLPTICMPEKLSESNIVSNCKENDKAVPHKQLVGENMIRVNYLLQATRYVASQENIDEFHNDSSHLGTLCSAVSRKGQIRVAPDAKRLFCKGCGTALIPTISSRCRLRKNRQIITCLKCHTIKRFPSNPYYSLWFGHPESYG